MSESPRILGLSLFHEDHACGAVFNPDDGGKVDIFSSLPVAELSTFCSEHYINEIRVLLSSPRECWVQIPEITSTELHPNEALTISLLLDITQNAVVEQFIHPLGSMCPLSILIRSTHIDRYRKVLPQTIPHDFFTEASVAPLLGNTQSGGNRVILYLTPDHLSAFFVGRDSAGKDSGPTVTDSEGSDEAGSDPKASNLLDAVRIPFEEVTDLSYLVRDASKQYPWLPEVPIREGIKALGDRILSENDLVQILARSPLSELKEHFHKETRRIDL